MREYALKSLKSSRWHLSTFLVQPWTERAECIRHPQLPWTKDTRPDDDERLAMAQVCNACPVLAQCADFALTGHNGRGVDGGFYAGVWIPWAPCYDHRKGSNERGRARYALRRRIRMVTA